MNLDEMVWTEKYRPQKISDCILPSDLKKKLTNLAKKPESMPNLLMAGKSGVGKTTAAKALMNEIDADYIMINASKDRNIDTLRVKMQDFASTVSFSGGRKFIILDESDYLNPTSTQPALRNFMEDYAANCGFILTCNFENKLLEPLRGRCSKIDFSIPKSLYKEMFSSALARFTMILENEGVKFDKSVLIQHIMNFYPDLRKTLNELQAYSKIDGEINTGILSISSGKEIETLIKILKDRNFTEMRKWVAENDLDMTYLIDNLYRKGTKAFEKEKIPFLILHLANYDYKNSFVANKEINTVAMLTEIMRDVV